MVTRLESVVQSSLLAQTLRKEDRVLLSQHTSYIVKEYLEETVFETHCGRTICISRQLKRDTL